MYLSIHQSALMTVEEMLGFLSEWSSVIPFVTGVVILKKISTEFRLVTLIAALSTIPQLMNAFKLKDQVVQNFAYNFYTPLEFLLLYFVFQKHIQEKAERQILKASVVLYVVTSIVFIYNSGFAERFLNEWACINNFIYTSWILIIFYNQYSLSNNRKLDFLTPVFWIFIGLLLYTPCSSIVFSIWPFRNEANFIALKSIHHVVNIIMYVCFAIGIYKDAILNSSAELKSTTS